MPVADFAQNVQTPFFPMVRHSMDGTKHAKTDIAAAATKPADAATQTAANAPAENSFWQDVLDVVNPLQHLPVVGTVYRAITHDKIGDLEKVAGDTLYGGPLGLVSSLADVAFEKITGKSFEDTAMGILGIGGGDAAPTANTALAANAMKPLPPRTTVAATPVAAATAAPASLATPAKADAKPIAAQLPTLSDANAQALMAAMNQNGVDGDLGMRALFAYQKSLGLSPNPDGASGSPP